jgi:hypothetical protein
VRTAAAAALLLVLGLAACGGNGEAEPMSVADASRYGPDDRVVSVKGTLIVELGRPMLCSHLAGKDVGTACGSPLLWVRGKIDPNGWQGTWPLQWKESVVLRGIVGGGVIELAS